MKPVHFALSLLFILSTTAFKQSTMEHAALREYKNVAFTYGEELRYRVHYGWINAATIKIKVADKPIKISGRPTYNITAYGRTNKAFDWAYRVRDHFETYLDSQSIAPLKYYKNVTEDRYHDEDLVYYDHEKQWLKGKKKSMEIPAYLQDIVSGIFYARTIDFSQAKLGQTFPITIYLDQEIYPLQFKYIGKETIKTDLGKLRCIKLRPKLVVDRVFKDEDDMTIWITDDANKIPVRVKSEIYIGSLDIDITNAKGLRNPLDSKL